MTHNPPRAPGSSRLDGKDISMKILLVIPRKNARAILPAPDIGIAYIARAALDAGAEVEVLDAHKENMDIEAFQHFLEGRTFDLVGLKCLSTDLFTVLQYCKAIKKHSPDTVTVLGGPHPSALPEQTMQFREVDYVIRGEGETGFSSLVRKLDHHQGRIPLREMIEIPNLVYRDDTQNILFSPMAFTRDLDAIGFPAWHLFDMEGYPELPGSGGRFLPITTTRGCPSQCVFCCSNTVHGKAVRTRSPEHVIEEIQWLIRNYKIQKVSIFDNNFTFHKDHALKFCELYRKNRIPLPFDIPQGVRIDKIDLELLKALEAAGCTYIGVGIESGSQKTLDRVRKGTTISGIKEKIRMIKQSTRIQVVGFFIIGFPHETEADVLDTVNFALQLHLDYATFTIFTPFPGTVLFQEMVREGYFSVDHFNWEDLLLDRAAFQHRHIRHSRLKMLQRMAYIKFYFRPSKMGFFIRIVFQEGSLKAYLTRFWSILSK